ncbi:hypothetical protein H3N56_11220 [Cetobacterium sp. 2A]|uniref:hypothetical protein n=1 Tax=Cetobacterium sp. 2A TaxID=2754723 RepID=UPI00163CCD2B|nr:hypothetical protein [Cetobacterium sp. 2A]MBC2857003.1 hypothetical protein [Cetobacterium sp. 2A]
MSFLSLRGIPYYPELSLELGNEVTASIVMTQLEYWFGRMDYKPFFKFLEPIPKLDKDGNEKNTFGYKDGDSWIEELKISSKSFRTAFAKIGVAYTSKHEFDKAISKFKKDDTEYYYCCYSDRQTRKTYYYRNHKLVDSLAQKLNSRKIDYDDEPKSFSSKKSQNFPLGSSRNSDTAVLETPIGKFSNIQEITSEDYQENTTTTKQDNINYIEPVIDKIKNSGGSLSLKIKDIKKYLHEEIKDIVTCKNIMFLVENRDLHLEKIKEVVNYANKHQKGSGFIYKALEQNWILTKEEKSLKKGETVRGARINYEALELNFQAEKEKEEALRLREKLDNLFDKLSEKEKIDIENKAYEISLRDYGQATAKVMARTKTKYEILKQYYLLKKGA